MFLTIDTVQYTTKNTVLYATCRSIYIGRMSKHVQIPWLTKENHAYDGWERKILKLAHPPDRIYWRSKCFKKDTEYLAIR